MKQIQITVGFKDASGGLVHIVIQGTGTNYNYDVDGPSAPDNRDFHIPSGLYAAKVHGMTGGSCYLKVTGDVANPIDDSADGPNISINDSFVIL